MEAAGREGNGMKPGLSKEMGGNGKSGEGVVGRESGSPGEAGEAWPC